MGMVLVGTVTGTTTSNGNLALSGITTENAILIGGIVPDVGNLICVPERYNSNIWGFHVMAAGGDLSPYDAKVVTIKYYYMKL